MTIQLVNSSSRDGTHEFTTGKWNAHFWEIVNFVIMTSSLFITHFWHFFPWPTFRTVCNLYFIVHFIFHIANWLCILYRVFLLQPRPTAHFLHAYLSYFTNPASWLPHWNKRLSCLLLIHSITAIWHVVKQPTYCRILLKYCKKSIYS